MRPLMMLAGETLLFSLCAACGLYRILEGEETFEAILMTVFSLGVLFQQWWEHWQRYGRLVPLSRKELLTPERGELQLPWRALAARLEAQGAARDEEGRLCLAGRHEPDFILYRYREGNEAWVAQFWFGGGFHLENEHMRTICEQEELAAMPNAMRRYKPHGVAVWQDGQLAVYPAARAGEFMRAFGAVLGGRG